MRRPGRRPRRPKTRHPSRQRSRVYVRRPKRRRASLTVVKHAESPAAKRHKSKYDTKFQSTPERLKYREELLSERRKRGIAGKGGPDMSHTKRGTLVAESPHANRARHFKERGTLKSIVSKYNQLFSYETITKKRKEPRKSTQKKDDRRAAKREARRLRDHAEWEAGRSQRQRDYNDAEQAWHNRWDSLTPEQKQDYRDMEDRIRLLAPEDGGQHQDEFIQSTINEAQEYMQALMQNLQKPERPPQNNPFDLQE
jgi:hypothetical protein